MVNPALLRLLGAAAVGVGAAIVGKEYAASKERAAALQNAFDRFHKRIRHEQFGERDLLRERRETLQERLKQALDTALRPRLFQQGSYALQTGVKPSTAAGFDLDLGLILQCSRSAFASPVEAKQELRDVLRHGRRQVRVRRSCVTVEYKDKTFGEYHVDLAVYVQEPDGKLYLAKGKEHSGAEYITWERASPEELTQLLNSKFEGDEVAQFRRCVRYLKRWKQFNFTTRAPYSIALTVAAFYWFQPSMRGFLDEQPDDLAALQTMTGNMLGAIRKGRLQVRLPSPPHSDLLERLEGAQMDAFLERLAQLHQALSEARDNASAEAAVEVLAGQFGPDFR